MSARWWEGGALVVDGPLWVYRSGPLVVGANLGEREVAAEPLGGRTLLLSSRRDGGPENLGAEPVLAPWEAVVIETERPRGHGRG